MIYYEYYKEVLSASLLAWATSAVGRYVLTGLSSMHCLFYVALLKKRF